MKPRNEAESEVVMAHLFGHVGKGGKNGEEAHIVVNCCL